MNSDLEDIGVNPSSNPTFQSVLDARLGRWDVLRGSLDPAVLRHGAVLRKPSTLIGSASPRPCSTKTSSPSSRR
jgi:hypothetical protein